MIQELLNNLSMYRLVTVGLTILWLNAFTFSLFGVLDFNPVALILSVVVFISSTYIFSRLFGLLFKVKPHGESSIISGLILALLFLPSGELLDLTTFALIGGIAAASKFILVIHKRHIFNPAAIAATIAILTGLATAGWWIAVPFLLPTTLLFAALVLYKAQRLTMASVFLVVSTTLIILALLIGGSSLGEALTVISTWPLIFFAGFMLSEPLTLPPKRWQQFIEAGIVGILFALPHYVILPIFDPAFTLIIGNIIALYFARSRSARLLFKERRKLTKFTYEYTFETDKPLSFEAGQYGDVTLVHSSSDSRGMRRSFSFTSTSSTREVKFGIKVPEQPSSFKQALVRLEQGQSIQLSSIGGDFVLPSGADIPLLFIASGIGITPFISHLRFLKDKGEQRDIVLIYIVSSIEEAAYLDELKENGVKVFVINRHPSTSPSKQEIITAPTLTKELLDNLVQDIQNRAVYIAGSPRRVRKVVRIVRSFAPRSIETDRFQGY